MHSPSHSILEPEPIDGSGASSTLQSDSEDRGESIDRPLPTIQRRDSTNQARRKPKLFGKVNVPPEQTGLEQVWNIPMERNCSHKRSSSVLVNLLSRANSKSSAKCSPPVEVMSRHSSLTMSDDIDKKSCRHIEDDSLSLSLTPFGLQPHAHAGPKAKSSRFLSKDAYTPKEPRVPSPQFDAVISQSADEAADILLARSSYRREAEKSNQSEATVDPQRFSTPDRQILAELRSNLMARDSQFAMKEPVLTESDRLGHHRAERHHPFPAVSAPYPCSYSQATVDLDVWDTKWLQDACGSLTFHSFEKPPHHVLDIGCGTGAWILAAAAQWTDTHFIGMDIVPLQPDLFQVGSEFASRVHWVQGNMLEVLPFPSEEFDYVHIKRIARGVPEHKWVAFFEEVSRVMKSGAVLEVIEEELYLPGRIVAPSVDRQIITKQQVSAAQASIGKNENRQAPFPVLNSTQQDAAKSTSIASSSLLQTLTPLNMQGYISTSRSFVRDLPAHFTTQKLSNIPKKLESTSSEAVRRHSQDIAFATPSSPMPEVSWVALPTSASSGNFEADKKLLSWSHQITDIPDNPRSHTLLEYIYNQMHRSRGIQLEASLRLYEALENQFKTICRMPPLVLAFPIPQRSVIIPPIKQEQSTDKGLIVDYKQLSPVDGDVQIQNGLPEKSSERQPEVLASHLPKPLESSVTSQNLVLGISPYAYFDVERQRVAPLKELRTTRPLPLSDLNVLSTLKSVLLSIDTLTETDRKFVADFMVLGDILDNKTQMQAIMDILSPAANGPLENNVALLESDSISFLKALSPGQRTEVQQNVLWAFRAAAFNNQLPKPSFQIDLCTLNLHVALRTAEVLACAEAMWDWVAEVQNAAKVQDSSPSAITRSIQTLSKSDFKSLINKYEMHMCEYMSLGQAVEQCGWTSTVTHNSKQRKAFILACDRWDHYQMQLRNNGSVIIPNTAPSSPPEQHRRPRGTTRRNSKLSESGSTFATGLPTIRDSSESAESDTSTLKDDRPNRKRRIVPPLATTLLKRSLSLSGLSPTSEAWEKPNERQTWMKEKLSPPHRLCRTLQVFLARKN